MTIIGVVLNKLMSSKCMAINTLSYESFAHMASDYTKASIVLQLDDDSYLFVDMHKLASEQPLTLTIDDTIVNVGTWEQLQTYLDGLESDIFQRYLTTTIVPRYWQVGPDYTDTEATSRIFKQTPFHANIGTQLRIRSVENTIGLTAEYCDHNDFYERRNLGRSWNYPDVSIINTSVANTINLHNSIPVINGAVFYPEVYRNSETGNEELVAHEAGKWLVQSDWNQANVKTVKHNKIFKDNKQVNEYYPGGEAPTESAYCYNKNIVLIDFTPFGNIEIIKLSDCLNGSVEYGYDDLTTDDIPNVPDKKQVIHTAYLKGDVERPICSYYNIQFDLPKDTELGIPIVCICGRLFYLHEDTEIRVTKDENDVVTKITLNVRIPRDLFNDIILANLQGFGKQNLGTTFVEEKAVYTLNELFKDTAYGNGTPEDINRMLHEDNTVPFVIMIHTDKNLVCTKTKPIMTLGPDKFLFPPYAGGILVNKKTREIVDYVRQQYGSGTLVETAMLRPINFITKDYKQITKDSLAFEFNKYKSKSKYKHFDTYETGRDLDQYILIDFAYREN